MNSPRNTDRDAILARRALLISTALAGIACTGTKPASEGQKPPPVVRDSGEDGSLAPNTPWAEVLAQSPPLDIPAGLPEREAKLLRILEFAQQAKYAKWETLWAKTPDCGADADDCAIWAELAELLEPYYDDGSVGVGGCDSTVGETGTVRARWAAHGRFQQRLLDQLETYLNGVARHYGTASASAWQTKLAGARAPKPMPCLSPCEMPTHTDELALVPFARDSAALGSAEATIVLDGVRQRHASSLATGAKLVVRGHADPSEAEPEALATQRAEAVAAKLVEAGLDEAQLEVVGMGAKYLIERSPASGQGVEHNARVDFELVPPELAGQAVPQ